MSRTWNYLFVLVWVSLIIGIGVHLFSKGFLLTRIAQTDFNNCIKFDNYECVKDKDFNASCNNSEKVVSILRDVNSSSNICMPKKTKVILLVIDALRYDFGVYNHDLKTPLPYQNKLPIINEILKKYPDNSRLMKFVADPPTTTLQRLKGMTTGSLPTFIDIGSNFASPEINEDNIIDQIVNHNLSAVFMGDNTWVELFPNRFKRQHDYPSLNIYDLDTVDNGIKKYLPHEMEQKDWDIIIAHFLGVDHCGHKYGPQHPEMNRKLTEMDEVIRNVTEQMDENTTLIVIGDHGMTSTGDHGGESKEEVDSLYFMYSKKVPLLPRDYDHNAEIMQQIDLTPTLAALLGVSIPYSNLGHIHFQLLLDTPVNNFLRYQLALQHLWQNAKQMQNYFQKYAAANRGTFSVEMLEELENNFLVLSHRVNTVYTEAAFKNFAKDLKLHLKEILKSCRDIWVKFDAQLIAHGLIVTFLGIFTVYILISNSSPNQLNQIFNSNVVRFIISTNVIVGVFAFYLWQNLWMTSREHSVLFCTSIFSVFILIGLIIQNWSNIAEYMSKIKHFKNTVTRIVFAFTTCVFFANSFIIEEQKILSYVLIGLFILCIYELQRHSSLKIVRFKFLIIRKSVFIKLLGLALFGISMLRYSSNYFKCREEQANCTDYLIRKPVQLSKKINHNIDLMPIIALALFVTLSRIYLRSCGNLTGNAVNVILGRYGPIVGAICSCGHFILSKSKENMQISEVHVDALAWIVYLLFIVQLIVIIVKPLMIYILPRRNEVLRYYGEKKLTPEIYQQLKEIYNSKNGEPADDVPVICGLATVYSSVFVGVGVVVTILLAILLGPNAAMGLFIVIFVAVCYLCLISILQYERAANLEACVQPTFTTLLAWIVLVQFGFYATSHQPTMSQIEWSAAFVGRSAHYDDSNILSGILVLLNTFSSAIIFSLSYPLLIFIPFCIYTIWPALAQKVYKKNKKPFKPNTKKSETNVEYRSVTVNRPDDPDDFKEIDFDVTKGEINLYENENLFIGAVFKIGCQIIAIQGIRIFCAMFACTLHCRHLMVWKIFAPRFIYEGITSYVIFIFITLGFLLLIRVHISVHRMITKINKSR